MPLKTAYVLPYDVIWDGDPLMSLGEDVRVRVALTAAPGQAAIDAFDALLTPFELLARSGALAGSGIAPWSSGIAAKDNPVASGSRIQWTLRECCVDEKSIVILAQMLLSVNDAFPIAQLVLEASRATAATQRLVCAAPDDNIYPAAYGAPRFRVVRAAELGREVLVRATFATPASLAQRERLEAELLAWAAGLLSGAYGVAPFQPDRCVASVDNRMVHSKTGLTWALARFEAHPGAIDGLVNVFARFSGMVLPISELTVE